MITVQKHAKIFLNIVDRAILNTVFENTVRRVKCLEGGGG
jgi:hypothetical protein